MQFIFEKKIIFIVSFLLVIVAAIYAAQWKWHFWHPSTQSSQPAMASPMQVGDFAESENNQPDAIGIREVLSAHLFGQENLAKKASSNPEIIPKTQQPLELHGIVFIPNQPERAVALIAQTGGIAKDYLIGDEISSLPGWKVSLISPTSVQLEHEGTVELLELPSDLATQSNNPSAAMNPAGQPINPDVPIEDNPAPPESLPVEEPPPPPEENPALPADSPPPPAEGQSPPAQNPQELGLKKADDGFIPASAQSAQALGLKRADKIIAISGYDFADLESDPAVLKKLLAQPSIEAMLDRDGEVINFNVPKKLLKTWRTTVKS